MRTVSPQEFEHWQQKGRVIEKDARGPKVIILEDGTFLKIFHTRRHPFLARLQPAAKRFTQNTEHLRQLGIDAPRVVESFWIDKSIGLSGCRYQPLEGESVEHIYRRADSTLSELLVPLASFMRELHFHGIYFRSLHLGNIIRRPDGAFGLIDVLDLQLKRAPLSQGLVRRNLQHLRDYLDRRRLSDFPIDELMTRYEEATAAGAERRAAK
jgi:hypothetical protein